MCVFSQSDGLLPPQSHHSHRFYLRRVVVSRLLQRLTVLSTERLYVSCLIPGNLQFKVEADTVASRVFGMKRRQLLSKSGSDHDDNLDADGVL